MELILRRHGSTPGNQARRYIGRTDEGLSPKGRTEAGRIPPEPGAQRVYVSAYRRTRETAELLYPNARILAVAGFNEMDFGAFEGKNAEELAQDVRYRVWVDGNCRGACPEGETRDGFVTRCRQSFLALMEPLDWNDPEPLRLVVHGGTVMALMSEFALPQKDYFEWHVPPLGGYRCRLEEGLWRSNGRFLAVQPL